MPDANANLLKAGYYYKKQFSHGFLPVSFSHRSRLNFAIKLINHYQPKSLIDYGCGDGTFLYLIHQRVIKGMGIDFPEVIAELKTRFKDTPRLEFSSINDLKTIPLSESDMVFCMEVLEHVVQPQEIIKHLSDFVSPTGLIVISVPNEIGLIYLIKKILRKLGVMFGLKEYAYYEKDSFSESVKMVFATEQTAINRPIVNGGHSHKGFNWKKFKKDHLNEYFNMIAIHGTPFNWSGGWLSSQIWFIFKKK